MVALLRPRPSTRASPSATSSWSLVLSGKPVRNGGTAQERATITVTNTGDRAGKETVRVYTGALPTRAVRTPQKQLAGFAEVGLAPGQSRKVPIDLDPRAFSY
ncbi:fibronectin type III-like domain-contianing protein [uncultured Pseudokineococcus sp.]|uniref:fibronectin type III-like domain-contianing protein n=1 Tax=uncultured Pseudokineococcus sp. TaxID=1642928 RepID=UPI00263201C0|nr:fibronectin type III-like domain-contianing protein [uncultured Pseudokineococcus sp.]